MRRLFYLLLFSSVGLFAQGNTLFEEANEAYADGNYEEAIEKYNQILENGETAVAVHYNLGNAHYKLNNIAPSIYHYEKALQMDPQDEDVRNNIVFAQNMAIDAIEERPEDQVTGWMRSGYTAFSTAAWGWIAIGFMLLFTCLFLAYFFSGKPRLKRIFFISGLICLLLVIGSVFTGFFRQNIEEDQDYAIIFSEEAEVKTEPNVRSPEAFILHEGSNVEILEDYQEWSKIELANGNQGWMLRDDFKRL